MIEDGPNSKTSGSRRTKHSRSLLLVIGILGLSALSVAFVGCKSNTKIASLVGADAGTLLGVDANEDGVRDDIEEAIDAKYANSAKARAALHQAAKVMQTFLRDAANKDELNNDSKAGFRATECVLFIRGEDQAQLDLNWLQSQMYNTEERTFTYVHSQNNTVGNAYDLTAPDAMASTCDFDPSTLQN